MPRVLLRELVTDEDRQAPLAIRLKPGQHDYINDVADIYLEAEEEPGAKPRLWSVHDAASGDLVGLVMISDNIPEPIPEQYVGPYFLWKLMIDGAWQGRGYGRATVDAVVDELRARPNAEVLYTSCKDGPGSPRGFYLGYGFTDTGRVMWGENVLALRLPR